MYLTWVQVWALFVIWSLFYLLYFNIFSTTRSAVSKLVEPEEVGKIFTIIGVLEAVMSLVAKPLFGFIYQATLDILPGLWLVILSTLLVITLVLAIITHVGMTRERKAREEVKDMQMPATVTTQENMSENVGYETC